MVNSLVLDLVHCGLHLIMKMENGSILLAPQMRHIFVLLDSVASAVQGTKKEAYKKLPPWGFEPRPQPVAWIKSLVWEI